MKKWRSFSDIQYFKSVCFDDDGTAHLHTVILSAEKYRPEFYPTFKNPLLNIDGQKSPAVNKYSIVCLKPHNSAKNLFGYLISAANLKTENLRKSGSHFYSTSRGFDTDRLRTAFRRFCATATTVQRISVQLGIEIEKLQSSKTRAESVKEFLKMFFSNSRDDDTRPRSNEISSPRIRSRSSLYTRIPYTENRRAHFLFDRFEYLPDPPHIIAIIRSKLSSYSPWFQARLVPKLLYDDYSNLWAKNPTLPIPPPPLDDFFSSDFDCLGSPDLSAILSYNPIFQQRSLHPSRVSLLIKDTPCRATNIPHPPSLPPTPKSQKIYQNDTQAVSFRYQPNNRRKNIL